MNFYPKILISGQYFHRNSGSGITLSNLFSGWDKKKIADAASFIISPAYDVCDTYYQLGSSDFKLRFPFNLKRRSSPEFSGVLEPTGRESSKGNTLMRSRSKLRMLYDKVLFSTGLVHYRKKFAPGPTFMQWVKDYNPDILYSQLSSLEEIRIVTKLQTILKIPVVIHIMDDWPSTLGKKYFPEWIWRFVINRELRGLFARAKVLLSISEAMSEEYKRRYGLNFTSFHNPIVTSLWLPYRKKDYSIDEHDVTILYSGRIGIGISDSLLDVAEVIDEINKIKKNDGIRLHIQTSMQENLIIDSLKKYRCVRINPAVAYDQIPMIFGHADILLLANDFDPEAVRFLKYSMPTKASEYMISGTPILVYSADETAVTRFFVQNECGHCVTRRNMELLKEAIILMIEDKNYRQLLGETAVNMALNRFDSGTVRKQFRSAILNATDDGGRNS